MIESQDGRQHYLFAILLFIAGLLIILIFLTVRSQADDTTSSATVGNAAPTVSSVVINEDGGAGDDDSITPTAGSTKTVYIKGTVTDTNGCQTIENASVGIGMRFHDEDENGETCDTDNENCYYANNGTYGGCSIDESSCTDSQDTNLTFTCQIAAQFYVNADDWVASIWAYDGTVSSSVFSTQTTTIETCNALSVGTESSGILDFGTISPGSSSGTVTSTITNKCNTTINAKYSGTLMSCSSGYIATSSLHYVLSDPGFSYASGKALTETASTIAHNLAKRTESAASTDDAYWKINGDTGAGGTCSGTITKTSCVPGAC
ncbi:hypothetical protein H6758_04390 [Candidatus Nomurabacteria bacterium]|nr:hypothetical protein [Candidatus Nomurabacteria bacterium]